MRFSVRGVTRLTEKMAIFAMLCKLFLQISAYIVKTRIQSPVKCESTGDYFIFLPEIAENSLGAGKHD